MNFPVLVEAQNGHFVATLAGVPSLSVTQATRGEALQALKEQVQQRLTRGELVALEMDAMGVSDLAGKYQDDPTLREICELAYAARDVEE